MLLTLLACGVTPIDVPGTRDTADTASVADTADTGDSADPIDTALELHGEWAEDRIPAPEFVAVNRDGSSRSRPDLVGHPTVIWFYPAATTAG